MTNELRTTLKLHDDAAYQCLVIETNQMKQWYIRNCVHHVYISSVSFSMFATLHITLIDYTNTI